MVQLPSSFTSLDPKDPLVSVMRMSLVRSYVFTNSSFPMLTGMDEVEESQGRQDTFSPCERAMLDICNKTNDIRVVLETFPFNFAALEPVLRGSLTTRLRLSSILVISSFIHFSLFLCILFHFLFSLCYLEVNGGLSLYYSAFLGTPDAPVTDQQKDLLRHCFT